MIIGIVFLLIVIGLASWMGKGAGDALAPGINKLEKDLDQNFNQIIRNR
jgi:hypothetical protein